MSFTSHLSENELDFVIEECGESFSHTPKLPPLLMSETNKLRPVQKYRLDDLQPRHHLGHYIEPSTEEYFDVNGGDDAEESNEDDYYDSENKLVKLSVSEAATNYEFYDEDEDAGSDEPPTELPFGEHETDGDQEYENSPVHEHEPRERPRPMRRHWFDNSDEEDNEDKNSNASQPSFNFSIQNLPSFQSPFSLRHRSKDPSPPLNPPPVSDPHIRMSHLVPEVSDTLRPSEDRRLPSLAEFLGNHRDSEDEFPQHTSSYFTSPRVDYRWQLPESKNPEADNANSKNMNIEKQSTLDQTNQDELSKTAEDTTQSALPSPPRRSTSPPEISQSQARLNPGTPPYEMEQFETGRKATGHVSFIENESLHTDKSQELPHNGPILNLYPLLSNNELEKKTLKLRQGTKVKIGRTTPTTHRLASPTNGAFDCRVMSRDHATIELIGTKVFIRDNKSTHGTSVNGVKLVAGYNKELKAGDLITFGRDVTRGPVVHRAICVYVEFSGLDQPLSFYNREHEIDTTQQEPNENISALIGEAINDEESESCVIECTKFRPDETKRSESKNDTSAKILDTTDGGSIMTPPENINVEDDITRPTKTFGNKRKYLEVDTADTDDNEDHVDEDKETYEALLNTIDSVNRRPVLMPTTGNTQINKEESLEKLERKARKRMRFWTTAGVMAGLVAGSAITIGILGSL